MKIATTRTLLLSLLLLPACTIQRAPGLSNAAERARKLEAYLKDGNDNLNLQHYSQATQCFSGAVACDPRSVLAHNSLGLAYLYARNTDLAESTLLKAIELDPSYAPAYNNLGAVYLTKQKNAKAIMYFKKAIQLDPKCVSAHYCLGSLLVSMNQKEEGLGHLAKAIELDPDYLEANKAITIKVTEGESASYAEQYFLFAKHFAATGEVDRSRTFLDKAKNAGFRDWGRLLTEKAFDKIRNEEKLKEYTDLIKVAKNS